MNRIFWVVSLIFLAPLARAADVNVSIEVGQPGFYGRIDIGDLPHPELVFRQAIIVKPVVGVVRPPIYLHVPPGHARDWKKHCGKYRACGERVFFVHEHWYNDVYVPKYRERHGGRSGGKHDDNPGRGHGKGKNKHD